MQLRGVAAVRHPVQFFAVEHFHATAQHADHAIVLQPGEAAADGFQRKSEEAEQALWMLTAADQPDAAAVEAKVREIEKIKSDARFAFIRAVGDAANVLTAEQRKMVLGMVPMPGSAPMKRM